MDLSTRTGRQQFYRSDTWKNLRAYKLQLTPYCEECVKSGVYTSASEVHHIVDIIKDTYLATDVNNLQCLCKSCHSSITLKRTRSVNKFKRGHIKLRFGLK